MAEARGRCSIELAWNGAQDPNGYLLVGLHSNFAYHKADTSYIYAPRQIHLTPTSGHIGNRLARTSRPTGSRIVMHSPMVDRL